jgi:hypothetical protein
MASADATAREPASERNRLFDPDQRGAPFRFRGHQLLLRLCTSSLSDWQLFEIERPANFTTRLTCGVLHPLPFSNELRVTAWPVPSAANGISRSILAESTTSFAAKMAHDLTPKLQKPKSRLSRWSSIAGGLTVDFRKPCAKERVRHSQNHWAKKYTDQTKCYQTTDNPGENEQQRQVNAAPD